MKKTLFLLISLLLIQLSGFAMKNDIPDNIKPLYYYNIVENSINNNFDSYFFNENTLRSTFYINPKKWKYMTRRKKIELYLDCVLYNMAQISTEKKKTPPPILSKRMVYIRSSIDGKLLLQYDPHQGVMLKTGPTDIKELSKNLVFEKNYQILKPKNPNDLENAYKNKVMSKLNDNTYKYQNFAINRNYEIEIDKNGSIKTTAILYSDYYELIDDYAIKLIRQSAPFEPIPDKCKKETIKIHHSIPVTEQNIIDSIKKDIEEKGKNSIYYDLV